MQRVKVTLFAALSCSLPLFAGALTLQVDDLKNNAEARAQHAIVAAHITACHSPEKTSVTATAEGVVNGQRQSVPLKIISLKEPGAFAVAPEWPQNGTWVVKMVATNPDYHDYATSIIVPIRNGAASLEAVKVLYHAPSAGEISSALGQTAVE